jgi:hypothetical protein
MTTTANNNTIIKGRIKVPIGDIRQVIDAIKLSTTVDTLNFKNRRLNCLVRDWIDIGDSLLCLTYVSQTYKFLDLVRFMAEDQYVHTCRRPYNDYYPENDSRTGTQLTMFTYYETFSRDGTMSSKVDASLDSVLGKVLTLRPPSDVGVGLPWDTQASHLRKVGSVTIERFSDMSWWFSQE